MNMYIRFIYGILICAVILFWKGRGILAVMAFVVAVGLNIYVHFLKQIRGVRSRVVSVIVSNHLPLTSGRSNPAMDTWILSA